MQETLPALIENPERTLFPTIDEIEKSFLLRARNLLEDGYPEHALLDIWNTAIHNLRKRIEIYGVDLFLSSIKDEPGRKKYNKDGENLSERWFGVDDIILITGASRLGILNKKAAKVLEMVNWMRNHASPAHITESKVDREDVVAIVLILQKNLFEHPMPEPGHSPSGLFEPVKKKKLDEDQLEILNDQIRSFRQADIRVTFGFMLDIICQGKNPAYENVLKLFPLVWEKANDDLRKVAGERYHSLVIDPDSDDSEDKGAKTRLLEMLLKVNGIKYIPDATRAIIYRRAVKPLAKAKDKMYGWSDEEKAAKALAQFGPYVPSIAFEDVYQEILAVWCGNYWGRSKAYLYLQEFIDILNTNQLMKLARMFRDNPRVQEELFQKRPKKRAIELLNEIKSRLTIQAYKDEIDSIIDFVEKLT